MKLGETIIKIGLAIAAVAGITFLVVKYMDTINFSRGKEKEEDRSLPLTLGENYSALAAMT